MKSGHTDTVCSALSVALALALAGACGDTQPPARRPDVILVVIDTLRADALSCYGNPRPTTPHLDALARDGLLFEEVLAHAPNTAPSHASLFTGLHPWAHATGNLDHPRSGPARLADSFETLAERFLAAGWQTAAFTDGAKLGPGWNLLQGFEHVEADAAGVATKVDQALAFLAERRDGRQLFLFLHTYQVHMPYLAPESFARRFDPDYDGLLAKTDRAIREAWNERGELPALDLLVDRARFQQRDLEHLVALYHGELAYTDGELARLWAQLESSGDIEQSLIVVTADHGEEFGEHGQIGHRQLHRETLHVPLIVRLPGAGQAGRTGRRISGRVGLIDVHDSILHAAGLEAPTGTINIFAASAGALDDERAHYAERTDRLYLGATCPLDRVVRQGDRALFERFEQGSVTRRAYDLTGDAGEARPLARSFEDLEARLASHFAEQERLRIEWLETLEPAPAPQLDELSRRQLRALGY